MESWLTSVGVSAWNSGWNPLNSSVRFSAGVVWPRPKVLSVRA